MIGKNRVLGILKKIDNGIEKFSQYGLVVSLSVILFFCVLNIVLRWFDQTLFWIDPLVRHLVFVSAFLGGALATGRKQHIGIDIISKILEQKDNKKIINILQIFIWTVCFLTLVWLTKAGIEMAKVEFEHGKESFLGIHSGVLLSIIPVGFSLIGFRFFYLVLKQSFTTKEA